ncbi:MAG: cytochrome ubiquinol oxidase subunit I [Bacteroidetes bacterium]|nr:cytochrome ubiquinol oxidase subunit I [Bacteroidota bacterium]
MIPLLDPGVADWSRAQFAVTAMFHWLFVPLTLGLAFIVAIMETIYVKTGDPEWKKITRFWMTLFGINFAIGVATGIILEFEFGTNWSNYSWFVGDIFGAPLAIEGIMAFFLETTFVAVMFFGWNKIGKRFHLASTWLTGIGANLSALWILVANGWMQYPAGMRFNPDTARNEMQNIWEVIFSPVAIHKFLHTVCSGYVTAAIFVVGVSSWYFLKKRHLLLAKRSILIAAIFGLVSSLLVAITGDSSAYTVAQKQPMKLAAMENLYQGHKGNGLVVIGLHDPNKKIGDGKDGFLFKLEIPRLLSTMGYHNGDAFVPGIEDLKNGGFKPEYENISLEEKDAAFSVDEKIQRGRMAISALYEYRMAKKNGDSARAYEAQRVLDRYFMFFGYGYLTSTESVIPNVPLVFYSFRLMVGLGFWFIILFILVLYFLYSKKLENKRGLLWLSVWTIPLVYLASQLGWVVAEVGRQPWVIQDLLPVTAAVSKIDTTSIQITFVLFVILFTGLLTANITIMLHQIKNGAKDGGNE